MEGDTSNMFGKPHPSPISSKIGMASKSATCTSFENMGAEVVAISAAVKLFETDGNTDAGKLDDGTGIPSVSSIARIIWTKFFWTARSSGIVRKRMMSDTYKCHSQVF
jgi:hypothetical protein